ncbi:hypothetical protein [Sulfuritalea sp.]|uniref:hypothetical protein n=1 Tax=Sulfuritalea sp. TaxID=2480090 RepID=UPI00286E72FC|nr:hypothetical protein [Sulfuritalea sp.]
MFRQDLSQAFTRTMGCSGSELAAWLQRALPQASLAIESNAAIGHCRASYADGELLIEWHALEPRRIALLSVPQLEVQFSYSGMPQERRQAIQTYFDRATQRGGG